MEQVNTLVIERKIGYWQHMLSKIERDMLQMQSERVDVKRRLVHLQLLQKQTAEQIEEIVVELVV